MGRQPRLVADGLVYHALNRGNNRAAVFFESGDYLAFLESLRQTKERYPFQLFGYCLMGNHYHLVLQPEAGQNISRILQSLTVAHTWHHHQRCGSSGHVWQGRFKSPVIQDDEHLLTVLRYVESNPLRASMVSDLAGYPWSSYICHGLGKSIALLDETPLWMQLGKTDRHRQSYCAHELFLLRARVSLLLLAAIFFGGLASAAPFSSALATLARRASIKLMILAGSWAGAAAISLPAALASMSWLSFSVYVSLYARHLVGPDRQVIQPDEGIGALGSARQPPGGRWVGHHRIASTAEEALTGPGGRSTFTNFRLGSLRPVETQPATPDRWPFIPGCSTAMAKL